MFMGLWSTLKGWLNIGGVQVLLEKYTDPLKRSEPVLKGAVLLKAKSPKTVNKVEVKFIEEFTHKKDGEQKTDTTVLGRFCFPEHDKGIGYPIALVPGENKEQPFTVNVSLSNRLQDFGGVLGAVGKFAAFASSEKVEYFLVASASVKGAAFDTSHKVKMKIAN
jgi:hypothetical protein